ncbi:MAG TPA: N-acetylmuramoyl-L-alanine amidase [Bacteroidetes bacterium]|nr:N-acetylmuramoyl-L-alanine amidase [Bacteroidota bacterium]
MKRTLVVITVAISLYYFAGCSSSKEFSARTTEEQIMSVQQWGGTPANDSLGKKHLITHITLHHQGEPFPKGKDPIQYLRNLQNWSRREKKWIDIPYHYIIDLDGKIYEGRNINYAGDTNTEYDPTGHALIEVVGNFEEVEPNEEQLDATVNLMTLLAIKFNVPADSIRGHKDYSSKTVCPGKNLYLYLENGYFKEKVENKVKSIQIQRLH